MTRAALLLGFAFAALLRPSDVLGDCSLVTLGFRPLNDSGIGFYQGFRTGLYPDGANSLPPVHAAAGLAAAQEVVPLNAEGMPDPVNGRIVMISVGMSNTTQEFAVYKQMADADPAKNPRLVIVDGAQGSRPAPDWINSSALTWNVVDQRLVESGVTPAQVQVAWIKQARRRPQELGGFPFHAEVLRNDLGQIVRALKTRYPNVRIAYLSSRTRAYTLNLDTSNPEPFAYESGFSVKWLIERQMEGLPALNFDPANGQVLAPWLAWGPYLWIDGTNARSDGQVWLCSDVAGDFFHPSHAGRQKVARQLTTFFKTDPAAALWYLKPSDPQPQATISASVSTGIAPLEVQFTASASSSAEEIVEYAWSFDDGGSSLHQNPVKFFPTPGFYNVRLTVSDSAGNTARLEHPIEVKTDYHAWRTLLFDGAPGSGPLEDPDGDGRVNLLEYWSGTNPRLAEAPRYTIRRTRNGEIEWIFSRVRYAADLEYMIEAAGNVTGPWVSLPVAEEIIDAGTMVETVRVTVPGHGPHRFFRLHLNRVN